MDKDITNRIIQYLEIETNYAIIINGDYGIGKTYYIKNKLFPKVKETKVPNSSKKDTYIPILISLFGAKSTESIQDNIFFELYPILKKRSIKFLAGLGNRALKYFTDSEFKEVFNDTGTDSGSLTNYDKILLCIDDVDRISKDLNVRDVFGFINNLVENLNVKVLIIANEDELRKQYNSSDLKEEDSYSILREKVIGISIQFNPNIETTYDEIIKNKYESENFQYYDFLNQNKKYIIEQICINKHNIRNLLFFIEHFRIVYNGLISFFQENIEYKESKEEIELSVLIFSLPISIEYKLGKINSANFEEIKSIFSTYYNSLVRSKLINSEKKETEKSYLDLFYEKYYQGLRYNTKYYDSIFNYILGKEAFNLEFLKDDIQSNYKKEKHKIPRTESILNELQYWDCINLSIKEYSSLTRQLLAYVDKGEFDLVQYATVFHYSTRFGNPLRLNIDNLVKRFKRGILKGKDHYKYQANLRLRLSIDSSAAFYKNLEDVIAFCNDINHNIQKKDNSEKINKLFFYFKTDLSLFQQEMKNSEYQFSPFFTEVKFIEIWKIIKSMKNSDIIDLAFYFEYRYKPNIYEKLFPEENFIIELKNKLERQIKDTKTTKMKLIAYDFLVKQLYQSLVNFHL